MSRRCEECGAAQRMIDRPEGETRCAFCAGESPHPADVAAVELSQRSVPRFFWMRGALDSGPSVRGEDGRAGEAAFQEKRAAQRREWGGR